MKRWLAVALGLSLCVGSACADETINVAGQRAHKVSDYKRIMRVYDRFQEFPEATRHGLSLVFVGETLPDHGVPSSAGLVIHAAKGDIPLYVGDDRQMHVPMSDALRAENPVVLQTKLPEQTVTNQIFLQVAVPDEMQFTDDAARHWLEQVNDCVENLTGVLLAILMPDAHKLQVAVAPSSRFEMLQGGVTHVLVDNGGATPYLYTFRPQDFARDTVFRASKPLSWVRVLAPGGATVAFQQDHAVH
ncbi:DUF2987 domain-containing protein [Neokomagataea thailandica]|uniref:DUF2987 domain-containing protein n=1 Tax=Neokomagataea tanensis NBRC 106556 TaxID=1223519 RepID=A0ABQ0QLA8_9PROT|nr:MULTISPECIES: DUF2987 domain-containing protein [Neokomagataea]GBR49115.1 hypothetical protein AA106556_1939 [Neokomagataea tanensis NBRC 106556]